MNRSTKIKRLNNLGVIAVSVPLMLVPSVASATDFTAWVVMTKMKPDERAAYLAGVVEGLAYARYMKDNKNSDGMKCIYKWFYETDGTLRKIHSAFDRFPNHLPGAVIAAMTEKECGR